MHFISGLQGQLAEFRRPLQSWSAKLVHESVHCTSQTANAKRSTQHDASVILPGHSSIEKQPQFSQQMCNMFLGSPFQNPTIRNTINQCKLDAPGCSQATDFIKILVNHGSEQVAPTKTMRGHNKSSSNNENQSTNLLFPRAV